VSPLEKRARTAPAEGVREQSVHTAADHMAQSLCGRRAQHLARARWSREVAKVAEVPPRLAAITVAAQGAGAQCRKEALHPRLEAGAEAYVVLEHHRDRVRVVGLRAPLPEAQVRQCAAHGSAREQPTREGPLAIGARCKRGRPFQPQHLLERRRFNVWRHVRVQFACPPQLGGAHRRAIHTVHEADIGLWCELLELRSSTCPPVRPPCEVDAKELYSRGDSSRRHARAGKKARRRAWRRPTSTVQHGTGNTTAPPLRFYGIIASNNNARGRSKSKDKNPNDLILFLMSL
jgi:hypothetical protein